MATTTLPSDLDVQGSLTVRGAFPTIARATLIQESVLPTALPITEWRRWDAFETLLSTPAADDLGCVCGVWATGTPYLTAGDLKSAGATTRYGRTYFQIPLNYVAGETIQIAAKAGMLTTVADTSCTLDFECYKSGENGLISGSELVSTSATTMNSLSFAEKVFTVTPTTLSPGDWLDIRVAIACNDAATGTAVTPILPVVEIQCDVKG